VVTKGGRGWLAREEGTPNKKNQFRQNLAREFWCRDVIKSKGEKDYAFMRGDLEKRGENAFGSDSRQGCLSEQSR